MRLGLDGPRLQSLVQARLDGWKYPAKMLGRGLHTLSCWNPADLPGGNIATEKWDFVVGNPPTFFAAAGA
jgi:hypothetical protein